MSPRPRKDTLFRTLPGVMISLREFIEPNNTSEPPVPAAAIHSAIVQGWLTVHGRTIVVAASSSNMLRHPKCSHDVLRKPPRTQQKLALLARITASASEAYSLRHTPIDGAKCLFDGRWPSLVSIYQAPSERVWTCWGRRLSYHPPQARPPAK